MCGAGETCRTNGLEPEDRDDCGPNNASSGTGGAVLYQIVGADETITLATCGGFTKFGTTIRVYRNDNGDCATGNDDFCFGNCSSVSFDGEVGIMYDVIVGGYGANEGIFTLTVECGDAAITAAAVEDTGVEKPNKPDHVEDRDKPED